MCPWTYLSESSLCTDLSALLFFFNFFCHRQTFVPRFLATIPHTGAQIKMASTAKARVLLSTGWLLISDTKGDKNRKEVAVEYLIAEMKVFLIGKLREEGDTIALLVLKPLNSAWMPGPGCRVFNNICSCLRYNCQRQMLLYADYQLTKKKSKSSTSAFNSCHSFKPGAVVVGRDLDQLCLVCLTK